MLSSRKDLRQGCCFRQSCGRLYAGSEGRGLRFDRAAYGITQDGVFVQDRKKLAGEDSLEIYNPSMLHDNVVGVRAR